jgi:acyl dehydratase
MGINYGLNKLRFISPVPVGSKIRAKFELAEITQVKEGIYQSTLKVTMEREGANKPVLVAEWLSQYFV